MNKLCILFLLMLIACKNSYTVLDYEKQHVIETSNIRSYENEELNISIQLFNNVPNVNSNEIEVLDKTHKLALSISRIEKTDTVLFFDNNQIIILKNTEPNLLTFREYSISDTVIDKFYKSQNMGESFFRQTSLNKKHKIMVINDLLPYKNKYIQVISFIHSELKGGLTIIDPTDPDDMLFLIEEYKESLELSKNNAKNIYSTTRTQIEDPFTLLNEYFKLGKYNNYGASFLGNNKKDNYYKTPHKDLFDQALSTYYSFCGDTFRSDSIWRKITTPTKRHLTEMPIALNYLVDSIINAHQVVMFNEAHNVPKHRYTVGLLLEKLYNKGFRTLAIESFINDSILVEKGFPTTANGFYTREPTLANLIRKAHSIGYKIIEYDSYSATREKDQALNIYKNTIEKNVNEKLLVLAGYAHISMDRMAGEFYKITGIKPLTIDQTSTYFHYLHNCSSLTNQSDSSVFSLIHKDSIQNHLDVDIFLHNNVSAYNNCFKLNHFNPIVITIPENVINNCSMCCIYDEKEIHSFKDSNIYEPIPVSVCAIDTQLSLNLNLCIGSYTAIFYDNFGNILAKKDISVTDSK